MKNLISELQGKLAEAQLEVKMWRNLRSENKTLRDEFAMAALGEAIRWGYELEGELGTHKKKAANLAYEIADAMLEARKAKGE